MSHTDPPPPATAQLLVAFIILLVLVLALSAKAAYGHLAYGDWTCGFKHCVSVKR